MYAEVVVNLSPLQSSFHYHIPPELEDRLAAGHLVTVPFGPRQTQGVVVGFVEEPAVEETRPITSLVDPEPVLTRPQLDLAHWLAHHYLAPLIDCLTLMLPPGLSKKADARYSLTEAAVEPNTPVQGSLLKLLDRRGPLRGRQIGRSFPPHLNWRNAAEALVRRGALARESVLDPPSVRPKTVRTVRLAVTPAQAHDAKPRLAKSETQKGQAKAKRLADILDFLIMEGEPVDVSWVYAETGGDLQDLKELAEGELVDLGEAEVWRDSLADSIFVPTEPPELTRDQDLAWSAIRAGMELLAAGEEIKPYLLHGVTGSGKTEIYMRAVDEALARRQQAIVLVPEIALTPQTIQRFGARFPGRLAVIHSRLSEGERYDTWRRARAGLIDIVIGARSALFLPLPRIGLIVLDEEHDQSYKQDPPVSNVYYHARDAAVEYARQLNAACILGSATPDLVSSYRAENELYQRLQMPRRIMGHRRRLDQQAAQFQVESRYQPESGEAQFIDLPPVEVTDMRQELRAGNRSMFSRALHGAMRDCLERAEQMILFLNRRGKASYVFCRDCGRVLKCRRCDMPFTYHSAGEQLICHHCGNRRDHPQRCPACGSDRIRHFGAGTQKVEEEVLRHFPGARTLRWDWDVTRKKGAHELILQHFANREADVLIGTQMIAKGLDLPLVTLVGVVSADVGLALPDYRAAERTFQVLTQVAGRAGRGLLGGRVVLQTYDPEHYVIRAAAGHDYESFYRQELKFRRELGYPPFRRLVRLTYRHPQLERAEVEANIVAGQLRYRIEQEARTSTDLIGPAPCFFSRVAGEYRWQIVLRGPDPESLVRRREPQGWRVEVDPDSTL